MFKTTLLLASFLLLVCPFLTGQISCDPNQPLTETEYELAVSRYPECTPFLFKVEGKAYSTTSACEPNPTFAEDECWYARLGYQIGEAAQARNLDKVGCLDNLLTEVADKFGYEGAIYAYLLNKRGVLAYYSDEDSLAVTLYQRALSIREQIKATTGNEDMDHDIARIYVNMANSYKWLNKENEQDKSLRAAKAIFDQPSVRSNHPKLYVDFLSNAASFNLNRDDLDQAILTYQTLIDFQREGNEVCAKHLTTSAISARNQLVYIYGHRLDRYEEAERLAKEAKLMLDALASEDGKENYREFYFEYYTNYALLLTAEEKYEEAVKANFSALELSKDNIDDQININNNLGFLHILQEDFSTANNYLKKGQLLAESEEYTWHYPSLKDNFSDVANHNGDQQRALELNTQAILQLMPGQSVVEEINFSDVNTLVGDSEFLIRLLRSRAKFQRLANDLNGALQSYRQAAALIERSRKAFRSDNSKGMLAKRFKPVFADAVSVCWEFYEQNSQIEYAELALLFSEQNRSLILFDAVSTSQAAALLPHELANQDKEMQLFLSLTEKKLAEQGENTSSKLSEQVRKLRDQLNDFRDQLAQDYPEYYNWVTASATTDYQTLRQRLQPNKTYVEYFTTPQTIYAFVINGQDDISFHQLPAVLENQLDGTTGLLSTLRECMVQVKTNQANFFPAAHRLYLSLIKPLQDVFTHQELVIVPDGELAYLPFDLLPQHLPEKSENFTTFNDYLINSNIISYRYSLALNGKNDPVLNTPSSSSFLGIAPKFNSSFTLEGTYFESLQGTEELVNDLAAVYGNNSAVWGNHSKDRFPTEIGNYRIVQIASHALADSINGDNSYVLFGTKPEDRLFAKEIYGIHLSNTELVIISACQGALGNLKEGEGIISLGRSFFYAGAKAVVPTLWSVEEKSTLDITRYFHENIWAGQPKDHAMRNARQRYLYDIRNSENPAIAKYAHPYYWAAFIPIGNMDAINDLHSSSFSWHFLGKFALIILAVISAVVIIIRIKRK